MQTEKWNVVVVVVGALAIMVLPASRSPWQHKFQLVDVGLTS